jgi:hypothetical protein
MKKILLLLSILIIARGAKAQGNLQFNAVKTYTGTIASGSSPSQTVPVGKVWKVEKIITSSSPYTPNGNYFVMLMGLTINGVDCNYFYSGEKQAEVPFWLKAGDTFSLLLSSGSNAKYCISILEFNIIP